MPDKLIGFTQSSYPAYSCPPMRITKHYLALSTAKVMKKSELIILRTEFANHGACTPHLAIV